MNTSISRKRLGVARKSGIMAGLAATITLAMVAVTPLDAYAIQDKETKTHRGDKAVRMEANAWNSSFCPKDGLTRFHCDFKTSAKTKRVSNGSAVVVSKIRNTYAARCSGVGVSISISNTGFGAGAAVSSTEATNYVQNTKKSIADKAGAVTCHIDPLRAIYDLIPILNGAALFDRYTTGSYTEAWINGVSDHTSWAWTW